MDAFDHFSRRNSFAGQAMTEFLLVLITFLFSVLGVIQLAMVLNAYSLVRYAAYNAARAGAVHGGSMEKMEDAARLSLLATFPNHGRADTARGFVDNYLGAKATDKNKMLTYFRDPITAVRVLHKDHIPCGNAVTFDDPADADDSLLTVQVEHQYELVIPLVNRILFFIYRQIRGGGTPGEGNQTLEKLSSRTDKLRRISGQFKDIEYRIPLIAHYTMRMQSDFTRTDCSPPPPASPPPPPPPPPTTVTTTTVSTTIGPCGVFVDPMIDGMPLDHCLHFSVECGQPAADAYCVSQGCARASSFTRGPQIWKTRVIDGSLCDATWYHSPFCTPFAKIVCGF